MWFKPCPYRAMWLFFLITSMIEYSGIRRTWKTSPEFHFYPSVFPTLLPRYFNHSIITDTHPLCGPPFFFFGHFCSVAGGPKTTNRESQQPIWIVVPLINIPPLGTKASKPVHPRNKRSRKTNFVSGSLVKLELQMLGPASKPFHSFHCF